MKACQRAQRRDIASTAPLVESSASWK
jgi:hypothetical protein